MDIREEFRARHQLPCDRGVTRGRFKGKVAVIVGGASGIGFATAERFANDGAFVAIVDVNREGGKCAEEYIKSEGCEKVKYYYANVTDKSSCDVAAQAIAKDNEDEVNFLINCAVYFKSQAMESNLSDWRKTSDVNIYGSVAMLQACHPFMKKAGGCAIVNISSISACRPQTNRWEYSASKAAIEMLTKNMALDLSKDNIRVNSVAPGWIWSPEMAKASPDGTKETILPHMKDFVTLKRPGETCEVASVITFLCSSDASYLTGTNIPVDGGYAAMGPERHGNDELFASNQEKYN